jgi:hypothetical protein
MRTHDSRRFSTEGKMNSEAPLTGPVSESPEPWTPHPNAEPAIEQRQPEAVPPPSWRKKLHRWLEWRAVRAMILAA